MMLGAAALTGLGSCQADMETPELQIPEATLVPNTTIQQLKELYKDQTAQIGLKDEATGEHYIIHGRVISSDANGNIYKSLVIQDQTGALAFSLNQRSIYCDYPLGQDVVVDMTGLYIGYYRGLQQIGAPGDEYQGAPQLGFMAYDYFTQHAQKNGLPDVTCVNVSDDPTTWPSETMYCITLSLPIPTSNLTQFQSQLVEVRDVHFVDGGKEDYAPHEESVTRDLANDQGSTIGVRNSGYSSFWADLLPVGKGNVRGILSYYGDSWQLLLRSTRDVLIDDLGTVSHPFSVNEMLNPDNSGRSGWAEGYIVGSVKAGVEHVKSADDLIFGAEAELDNNVVISDNPFTDDPAKCVVVRLPQGSDMRNEINLIDNPGNYRKKFRLQGTISLWMDMTALIDCIGDSGDFKVE